MLPFIAAIVGSALGLKRTCRKCGKEQVVPRDKRHQEVRCKFCHAILPPPDHRSF